MPIALKFLLTNPALRLHIEEGVETSSLWFDVTIERPPESRACLKIFFSGRERGCLQLERQSHYQAGCFRKTNRSNPRPLIPMTRDETTSALSANAGAFQFIQPCQEYNQPFVLGIPTAYALLGVGASDKPPLFWSRLQARTPVWLNHH